MEILVKKSGLAKLVQNIPYLTKDDVFEQLPKEGTVITLVSDSTKSYSGYVGKEHRSDIGIVKEELTANSITNLINKALQKRVAAFKALPQAYRLIHNEADGLPGIAIEVFKEFAVCTYFNKGIIKFEALICDALQKTLPLKGIYVKYRTPQIIEPETQLIWGEKAPERLIIAESTGQYIVKLNQGLMTGLFLDQRANRIWLQSISSNKTICNTFSYTGALSIACALGGAKATTSVDLSATYSHWTEENIALNHLNEQQHQIVISDTFAHFEFCRRKGIKYDILILDPPTFAKKKGGSFSVGDNYKDLVIQALPLVTQSGILVCSTNFSQWSVLEFQDLLLSIGKKYGYKLKVIYQAQADKDFPIHPQWPESNHLKFVALQID